jgi:DNA-binding response OmpR family regulator
MRILVIEDNPKLAAAIQRGLTEHGFQAEVAHRGYDGEEKVMTGGFAALVLDVMLTDRDGVELCRALRRRGLAIPILMLTALSRTSDKVSGLEAGADDYLTKPFEFAELVARLRALLRRGQATEAARLQFEDLEVELTRREVRRAGTKIKLSAREFALLEYLMRHKERVLTRLDIGEAVWDLDYEPSSNVIDVYISSLRKKLDQGLGRPLIHTVIGMGYRFGSPEERTGQQP